ncbi:flavin reductase family protein [Rhodococcus wratislaviensis]|uniref:flavin reductase family protein n=1 Tax=Rhodococcus wratislaviensis TaxID=44752 RepID=UPI003517CBC2
MSSHDRDRQVSPDTLRKVVGRFTTGVTVVTALDTNGGPAGCTVSAFASLSLDPPLVLVCIDSRRPMHTNLLRSNGFAVNILAAGQEALALGFARPSADKFAGVGYRPGRHGVPLLHGAVAQLECDLAGTYAGGDHTIVLGRVAVAREVPGEPLVYGEGRFLDSVRRTSDRAMATAPE